MNDSQKLSFYLGMFLEDNWFCTIWMGRRRLMRYIKRKNYIKRNLSTDAFATVLIVESLSTTQVVNKTMLQDDDKSVQFIVNRTDGSQTD